MKALATLFMVLGVTLALGRVGETLDTLVGRYGEPYVVGADTVEPSCAVYGFDKAGVSGLRQRGFEIFAVIDARQACRELVYVKTAQVPLANDEVQGILLSNGLGMPWKTHVTPGREVFYVRADGIVAFPSGTGRFEVVSADRARVRRLPVPADS